ncbi:hypothetical protein BO71DRAFT_450640 [Aspergillus ellipticus CBS 707.79]|uniref:Uncharacterized protein n=1 Tax=Aspergillus ellipticus CBS 707.79 TaxID=1448320 RepID=A0A319D7Z0_9EURO|nr:hypothetical protein BO71DRAFT_450640 [Aspergillus ellipticus CBS 707.79]
MLPHTSRKPSAYQPPAHGSRATGSQKAPSSQPPNHHEPFATGLTGDRAQDNRFQPCDCHKLSQPSSLHTLNVIGEQLQGQHHHLAFEFPRLDRVKDSKQHPKHNHKRSKSSDSRIPRRMNNIALSAGARGLLPTWSGSREKDHEADGGLLRPMPQETSLSRWGPESTAALGAGGRRGTLFEAVDQNKFGLIKRHEIRSTKDLDQVKSRRKQGEEYLRSALSLIGTLATDITRRLDYTYYNLLEKVAALNSTISSFQELSRSTDALFSDFQRETSGLEQEIRKQVGELKEFQPQLERIKDLEARMKTGRVRAETLGNRLEAMRHEIDSWDEQEMKWQSRVNRRLRIFWTVIILGLLAALLAIAIQNRSTVMASDPPQAVLLVNSSYALPSKPDAGQPPDNRREKCARCPLNPSHRYSNCHSTQPMTIAVASTRVDVDDCTKTGDKDSLRVFDEL